MIIPPVKNWHVCVILKLNPVDTGGVHTVFRGGRAAMVMCVDPADFAKVMLGAVCVECVGREGIMAFDNLEILDIDGNHNRPPPRAHRTVTPPCCAHAVGKVQAQLHRAAVTGQSFAFHCFAPFRLVIAALG